MSYIKILVIYENYTIEHAVLPNASLKEIFKTYNMTNGSSPIFSPLNTNLNPALENNNHRSALLNHNVVEQPTP